MANNQINNEYVQKGYLKAYLANRGIKVVDYDEWEHLCDCIDDAKAADVRENVRGEWIKTTRVEWCGTDENHKSIYRDVPDYKCSLCGNPALNRRTNFCPNCGADMRERKAEL